MDNKFITVTELIGHNATGEQLARMLQRYRFAAGFSQDKDVLEVACGGGMGLGYLASKAKRVVGGDIEADNIAYAKEYYRNRDNVEVKIIDAQKLEFPERSFDVVILYEAIYYLQNAGRFIDEAFRVLRDKGVLIICTVNREWEDFNPSPFSVKYYSLEELKDLVVTRFSDFRFYGGFSTRAETARDHLVSFLKKLAVSLHLVPKTMKGKELLKRFFFGKLKEIPPELNDEIADYVPPTEIPEVRSEYRDHKVLFVVADKNS